MFTISKTYINVNDSLFCVVKTIKEELLKESPDIEALKSFYHGDHIFKKDGVLYICEKIQDLEIIPDLEELKTIEESK